LIEKVISGGQTGVDQAGLDYAIEHGIPHGGYVPKGRKSEAGPIPAKYQMTEHPASTYPPRTEANVAAADATVIFTSGLLNNEPGCLLTVNLCRQAKKPFAVVSLLESDEAGIRVLKELIEGVKVLNVAGPRGSHKPDIAKVKRILAGAIEKAESS
jgi:hypothetical protein